MGASRSDGDDGPFFDGPVQPALLGIAYVVVALALFYSLAVGATELLMAVLAAILGLVAISLSIVFRREGFFTPENKLIGVFVLLSLGLLFGLSEFTDLPAVLVYGVVIVVGVLVPNFLMKRSDDGRKT